MQPWESYAAKWCVGEVERYSLGGQYDESKHPRERDGRFTEKGSGSTGSNASKVSPKSAPSKTGAKPSVAPAAKVDPRAAAKSAPKRAKPTIEAKPEEYQGTLDALQAAIGGVGLIPGWGEAADLANAAIYLARGQYTMAGLSLVSMVPVVGDAIGKGGQSLIIGGKYGGKTLARIAPLVEKNWPRIKDALGQAKDLKKYAGPIDEALRRVIETARKAHGSSPKPAADSPQVRPVKQRATA